MRTLTTALAFALVLTFAAVLFSCGGSTMDQDQYSWNGSKETSGFPTLTTDLIAGGSAGSNAGNNGWDAGDVSVSYSADGTALTVSVTLDTGVTFKAGEAVKLYASTEVPDSDMVKPGQMPYSMTISGTTASKVLDLSATPGANLYLLLHAVVCKDSAVGYYSWTGTAQFLGGETGKIWVGQNDIGATYDLSIDGDYFKICVHAPAGWTVGKIDYWYGTSVNDIPKNPQGKYVPGQYPYHFFPPTAYNPYTPIAPYLKAYASGTASDYCFMFKLEDMFPELPETLLCKDFVGSMHMEFFQDGVEGHQTGWAEKPAVWNIGSYFTYKVCAKREYHSGGTPKCDTAWAYDPTSGPYPGGEPDPELGYFEIFPWSDGGTVSKWGWVFYYPYSPGTPWS